MSYNNLTFESDRKTLRHDSYRRGRLGIKEMPMYNGFRGSRGESIGTQRTFRCLSTVANYTTKAATQPRTHLIQSSRVGGRKGQARQNPVPERPVKGKYCRPQSEIPLFLKSGKNPLLQEQRPSCHSRPDRESSHHTLPLSFWFIGSSPIMTRGFTHRTFQPVT